MKTNNILSSNVKSFLTLFSVFTLVLGSAMRRLGCLQMSTWDDGNLLMGGFRRWNGQVPNVDYVSGYPGAFDQLLAWFFSAFGINVFSYQYILIILLCVITGLVFYILKKETDSFVAASAAILTFLIVSRTWSPEPGTVVQCLIFLIISFLCRWYDEGLKRWIIAAAAACGISFWFKQSAVIIMVACSMAIAFRYSKKLSGWEKWILLVLPHWIVFALFLSVRFKNYYPLVNSLCVMPWLITLMILASVKSDALQPHESLRKYITDMAIFSVSALGISGIIFLFYFSSGDVELPTLLNEMFVRLPALIDRHILRAPLSTKDVYSGLLILIAALFVKKEWLEKIKTESQSVLTKILVVGIFFIFFFLFFVTVFYYKTIWVAVFLVPAFFILLHRGMIDGVSSEKLYGIFGLVSVLVSIAFPYPSMEHIGGLVIFPFFFFLGQFVLQGRSGENKLGSKPVLIGMMIATIVLFLGGEEHRNIEHRYQKLAGAPLTFEGTRITSDHLYFVKVAHDIHQRVAQNEKVSAFPNLALSMFGAGRVPASRMGNYFGNEGKDFSQYINELVGKKVEWLYVNENYYPYPENHPFFPPYNKALEYIKKSYQLVSAQDGILVFRLKGNQQ